MGGRARKPARAASAPRAGDGTGGRRTKAGDERCRAIIAACPDGFCLMDREGRVLEVNEAYARRSGYALEELVGMHISRLEALEDPAATAAHIERIVRDGSDLFETLHRAKDGTTWRVEVHASYRPIDGGLFFSFLRDITGRRRAEEALRASEERLQLAMRGANDGLWDWDLASDEVYYSPRWKSILGYGPDELEHTLETWKRLVHPDDREHTLAAVGDLVEGRSDKFEVEFRMFHRDGGVRHVLSRAFLAGGGGGRRRLVGTHVDITERTQAEERSRRSEARLKRAEGLGAMGHWEWDFATGGLVWSDEVYRIYGMDPARDTPSYEVVVGTVAPECRERFVRAVEGAVHRGAPFDGEYRMIGLDGTERFTHTSGEVIRDGAGRPLSMFGVVQDITERRRAQERVAQSEEKYRTLFTQSAEGIFLHDLDGRILDANEMACAQSGYAREELLGLTVFDLLPDAGATGQLPREEILRLWANWQPGQLHTLSVQHRRRDGTLYPAEIRTSALRYGDRSLILAAVQDISERRRTEERLRESEEFIRGILDSVDEGFIVIDREYRVLTANAAYCAQVGRERHEVVGGRCHELSHGSSRPCHERGEECAVRHVLATGEPHTALHRHRDRDGGAIFVETKAFPLRDASGEVVSVIETINNITERHLLEEERLKTQKLESIGTLAGGIAHDFNNLLQGVFGYISMAKLNLWHPERCRAMLENAERALQQSVSLTTQLLTFSKGGRPVRRPTALAPVIENAARFALSGSRSEYRVRAEPGLWLVDADGGQIGQVLQNIVLNADQAMPHGGRVEIEARNLPAGDEALPRALPKRDHVVVSVRDSGGGVPPEHLDRIFDPYFTTKEKGSGLGLATSYSILRSHDGLIEVTSEPGAGSTFRIFVPAAAEREEPPPQAPPPGTKVGRVLVMDDDEIIRGVAGELLRALGHAAVFAERGETALEAYRDALDAGRPFDAVILDLTIRGGMGGEETLRRLREIDPGVRAIVSSGYSDGAALADHRQQGFRAFLKKPYRIDELQGTLSAVLSGDDE